MATRQVNFSIESEAYDKFCEVYPAGKRSQMINTFICERISDKSLMNKHKDVIAERETKERLSMFQSLDEDLIFKIKVAWEFSIEKKKVPEDTTLVNYYFDYYIKKDIYKEITEAKNEM